MGKRNPETFYCVKEKYKQYKWAKGTLKLFYWLKEKHVSRENSSLKVNGTVIT